MRVSYKCSRMNINECLLERNSRSHKSRSWFETFLPHCILTIVTLSEFLCTAVISFVVVLNTLLRPTAKCLSFYSITCYMVKAPKLNIGNISRRTRRKKSFPTYAFSQAQLKFYYFFFLSFSLFNFRQVLFYDDLL